MLLILCLSFWSLSEQRVQLVGDQTDFNGWTLRTDDGVTYDFDAAGSVQLPAATTSFEIIDDDSAVRFFGLWRNYEGREEIEISVEGGLRLTQVVSASRMEQDLWRTDRQIDVVRPEDTPERAVSQTSDLLKEDAEVLLQKTNLGGGSPIVRGMSGNRVLLMVDGFRLNNSIFRLGLNQYLNTVPSSHLAQIEVLSGPSGVQYGSDGLGGTIHLRGADPASLGEDTLEYHGFYSGADDTNTHRLSGHASRGAWHVQGHYQFNNYENLEAADPVGEQIPTGYEGWDASLNLSYVFDGDTRLRIINNVSEAANVPRTDRVQSGRDLLWEYNPQKWRLHGLRLESSLNASLVDYLDVGLGYMEQDEGTRRIPTSDPNRLIEDRSLVDTFQFNGSFTKLTERVQWVYGFDAQDDSVDTSAREVRDGVASPRGAKFPGDSAYRLFGLFATAQIDMAENHQLNAGLRQTWAELEGTLDEPIGRVNETFEQLTPSLTWSYNRDQWFLSLGVSQGFRAPNLEDTLALGPSNSGFDAPNPSLEPEELWSYESTFRYRTTKLLVSASAYTSRYDKLIDRVAGTYLGEDTFDGEPVFILDNVGEAQVDGASIGVQYQFNTHHSLKTDAAYTYGRQLDADQPMRRIPPLRGNLSWLFQKDRWRGSALFTWADRQDKLSNGDINDFRIPDGGTPGYGAVHLRGRYELNDNFAVNVAMENLFDKLYKAHGSGVFEPGRRAVIELTASWR